MACTLSLMVQGKAIGDVMWSSLPCPFGGGWRVCHCYQCLGNVFLIVSNPEGDQLLSRQYLYVGSWLLAELQVVPH